MVKKIELKGKTYTANTLKALGDKLGVTTSVVKAFTESTGRIYIKDNNNLFGKIDLEDINVNKQLEKFDIKKISNAELIRLATQQYVTKFKRGDRIVEIGAKRLKGDDKITKAAINIKVVIRISDEIETRHLNVKSYSGTVKNISRLVYKEVTDYVRSFNVEVEIISYKPTVISKYTKQKLSYDIDEEELLKECPMDISKHFNVDINAGLGCVNNMIRKLTPFKPKLNDIVTRRELVKYCQDKIHLIIYSIGGVIIYDNNFNSKYNINFIDYAGHCYPLINGKLSRHKLKDVDTYKYCEDINSKMVKCYKNNKYIYDIKTSFLDENKKTCINSFICDDVQYINDNSDHKKFIKLSKKLMLDDVKIDPTIKIHKIFNIMEKNKNIDTFSYFPVDFKKPQVMHKTNNVIDYDKVVTIDSNKCYSHSLSILEFIISTDYRTSKITLGDDIKEIVDEYLYIAEPINNDNIFKQILMDSKNIYYGSHIKFCDTQGVKYILHEEITTTKHYNKYGEIINEIYNNVDEKTAKRICNISIGNFKASEKVITSSLEAIGIFRNSEIKVYNGIKYEIDEEHTLLMDSKETQTVKDIYNKAPINIQIKDKSRQLLFLKLKELNIKEKDIVQINTDAISYYGKLPDNLNDEIIGDWKEIPFKEIGKCSIYDNINNDATFTVKPNNNNKLNNCNAGFGKTFDIINTITKKHDDYIVLTPSHKTCAEYRHNNINCNVIQTYIYKNSIPKEKVIIVDEVGMFDEKAHNILIRCNLLGKLIIAYGDFNQLSPCDINADAESDNYNSKQYINMMFKRQSNTFRNMRNNFTEQYYNSIINETVKIDEEVLKHSCKNYHDADMILTYTKAERDIFNDKMMKRLKFKFGDIGSRVICKTNKLKHKDIYNSFNFKITSNESGNITLDDKINITNKQLINNFIPYYASTLYSFQGDEIRSYYYPESQLKYIKTGKMAYTIISRLKQDLLIKEKEEEKEGTIIVSFD